MAVAAGNFPPVDRCFVMACAAMCMENEPLRQGRQRLLFDFDGVATRRCELNTAAMFHARSTVCVRPRVMPQLIPLSAKAS